MVILKFGSSSVSKIVRENPPDGSGAKTCGGGTPPSVPDTCAGAGNRPFPSGASCTSCDQIISADAAKPTAAAKQDMRKRPDRIEAPLACVSFSHQRTHTPRLASGQRAPMPSVPLKHEIFFSARFVRIQSTLGHRKHADGASAG